MVEFLIDKRIRMIQPTKRKNRQTWESSLSAQVFSYKCDKLENSYVY